MMTSGELDAMRAHAAALLPGTCDVLRPAHTFDDQGGWSTAWGTAGTAIPCRVDPLTRLSRQETVAGREALIAWYTLYLPHDADIRSGDRVTHEGGVYEVVRLHDEHTLRALTRVTLAKVD
jgi:hypothetical protein